MTQLEDQLTKVITRGLESTPELRSQLAGVLLFEDSGKVTKTEADYRLVKTNNDETCGSCIHFRDSSCFIVAGNIDPNYVSNYYEPRVKVVKDESK